MGILLDAGARLIIQGITGTVGRNAAGRMSEAGTPLVGGVTPGRGGQTVAGVPVFDRCHDAVAEVGATASFVLVPAPLLPRRLPRGDRRRPRSRSRFTPTTCPLADAIRHPRLRVSRGNVCSVRTPPACVTPGLANLSDLNDDYLTPGTVGIVAKSGAITYEVADLLRAQGLGISTIVCLGGDPVLCTGTETSWSAFAPTPAPRPWSCIGEIGGSRSSAATWSPASANP